MGCNNPNIDCLVSGDTLGYQVFGEGISPSGLRPLGDIPITSHLISQGISLNSSQYLVIIKLAAQTTSNCCFFCTDL